MIHRLPDKTYITMHRQAMSYHTSQCIAYQIKPELGHAMPGSARVYDIPNASTIFWYRRCWPCLVTCRMNSRRSMSRVCKPQAVLWQIARRHPYVSVSFRPGPCCRHAISGSHVRVAWFVRAAISRPATSASLMASSWGEGLINKAHKCVKENVLS